MIAAAARAPSLVPVHVGQPDPATAPLVDTGIPRRVPLGGHRAHQSSLAEANVDWERHVLEPRWLGKETADCAAAFDPRTPSSDELRRFLAGAASRGETALVLTVLGYAIDENRRPQIPPGSDAVTLPSLQSQISGRQLLTGAKPKLANDVNPADRDLGLRLLNSRPPDAPWWELKLHGTTWMSGDGRQRTAHAPEGQLLPILVDQLGETVLGAWVSPDGQQRWYIIPDAIDWNTILDWLVHQALPAHAPGVLRRLRTASVVDPDLQTRAEAAARQALVDMEARHVEERGRLEADLTRAQQQAEPVRYGLLHGTGTTLVDAVNTVLTDAGFTTVDLDQDLSGPRSADLLATLGQHRRLIEVKAVSGNAAENLVADLYKHLDTWPQLRPQLPAGGGALVINHQHKLPPDQRSRHVYTRAEFINTLTVPVIAARDLFDWWKDSNWAAIQQAVLDLPPASGTQPSTQTAAHVTAPSPTTPVRRRLWPRNNSGP